MDPTPVAGVSPISKIIGITSSYSAHAYLAIRLFLKNLEAIAFTSTVTFAERETDQHSANSLPQMDADKQTDYKHNLIS
jgi:hypothetical protein